MKNVLVLMHQDSGQEARVLAALDLARALEGQLTCLDVTEFNVVPGDETGAASTLLLAEAQAREKRNRTKMQARLSAEDVSWRWIDRQGNIAECIKRTSGLVDLIVLNRRLWENDRPDMRDLAGSVALQSHKPIVAVPPSDAGFDAAGPVLIAWDGSSSVMTTLTACVPLLKLARSVRLFTVDDGTVEVDPREAADYLACHDIPTEIFRVDGITTATNAAIWRECASGHYSYCLMGAYGHSRLAEQFFGGVTYRMLTDSCIPLVIGH